MNHLILYGAGNNLSNVYQAMSAKGVIPVCIVDGDPAKTHSSVLFNDGKSLKVLSLKETIIAYPNADFFVTPIAPLKSK